MDKKYFSEEIENSIKKACIDHLSMAQACASIGMNKNTFIFHAKRLGCYKPNQGGIGIIKQYQDRSIALKEILEGKHPQYQTNKLAKRLLKENIKEHRCENCNTKEWLGNPIPLELHHIDGNSSNHALNNLQFLCPNCHTLTDNYKSKNTKKCRE